MENILNLVTDNYQVIINIAFFVVTSLYVKDKKTIAVLSMIRDAAIKGVDNSGSKTQQDIIKQRIENAISSEIKGASMSVQTISSSVADIINEKTNMIKQNIKQEAGMIGGFTLQEALHKRVKELTK